MNLSDEIITNVFMIFFCGTCQCYTEENKFCLPEEAVVHRINQVSLEQCQEECGKRRHCKAINYRRLFKLCELLGVEQGDHESNHGKRKDCFFFKKSEMLNGIAAGCNCPDGLTCDPETNACTVTECPKMVVTNGQLFGNMFSVGSRVKFTCNPGYVETSNEMYSVCKASGQWSYQPHCIRDCGPFPDVANAMMVSSAVTTTEGAVVKYQCDSGYTFNGNSNNLTCTEDGIWFDQANVVCIQVVGIGDPCYDHSDCTLTEGICMNSKCFCSPLYSYKPEINDCFQECSSFTETFTEFEGTTVSGYNDLGISYPIDNAMQCQVLCLSESNCLSFEVWEDWDRDDSTDSWIYVGLKCNRASITYFNILDGDPDSVFYQGNGKSIYNRNCI